MKPHALSLQDQASRAVKMAQSVGATAADAYALSSTTLSASVRLGMPETIESATENGLGIRVFVGDRYASVSSADMDEAALKPLIENAVAMARASTPDPYAKLANGDQIACDLPQLDLYDAREISMTTLQEMASACEEIGRATAGITNSEGASASASKAHMAFASSAGAAFSYAASHYALSVSFIAGNGADMQRDYAYATTRFFEDLPSPETIAREGVSRTLEKMSPRKLPSQTLPIIFDPRVGRQLLGAFAGAINGASIARGTSFLKHDLGKNIFAPEITITDDPHLPRGLGSRPCDDEAVRAQRMHLVENGCLKSWLLDIRSAGQLGLNSAGHAQRSLGGSPHPSSSNLCIAAGNISPQLVMASYPAALYVTETFGHGVNLVTGDYSQGASGFYLEHGQRAYPVSEITIAGNLRDMFARLHAADDLVLRYATNVPTLVVGGMTIAGA